MSVNPQLVNALYGSTFISPTKNEAGKYSFAQISPQQRQQQQQVRQTYLPRAPVRNENLGGMLYKHAIDNQRTQKQSPNFANFNQNFYRMFAPNAYGPMPRPSQNIMTSFPKVPFAPPPGFNRPMRTQQSVNPYKIQVHGKGLSSAGLGYSQVGQTQNAFDLKGTRALWKLLTAPTLY